MAASRSCLCWWYSICCRLSTVSAKHAHVASGSRPPIMWSRVQGRTPCAQGTMPHHSPSHAQHALPTSSQISPGHHPLLVNQGRTSGDKGTCMLQAADQTHGKGGQHLGRAMQSTCMAGIHSCLCAIAAATSGSCAELFHAEFNAQGHIMLVLLTSVFLSLATVSLTGSYGLPLCLSGQRKHPNFAAEADGLGQG
jgi:hypothetical protein